MAISKDQELWLLAHATTAASIKTASPYFETIFAQVNDELKTGEREKATEMMFGLMPVLAQGIGFLIDWVEHLASDVDPKDKAQFKKFVEELLPGFIECTFNDCDAKPRGKIRVKMEYVEELPSAAVPANPAPAAPVSVADGPKSAL